jgi:IS1 family transposase
MDEMRNFYRDKKRQLRLWQTVGHETGEAVAFWLETKEYENLDALLESLNWGSVYTDGTCAYYERFSSDVLRVTKKAPVKDRKEVSASDGLARVQLFEKGLRF